MGVEDHDVVDRAIRLQADLLDRLGRHDEASSVRKRVPKRANAGAAPGQPREKSRESSSNSPESGTAAIVEMKTPKVANVFTDQHIGSRVSVSLAGFKIFGRTIVVKMTNRQGVVSEATIPVGRQQTVKVFDDGRIAIGDANLGLKAIDIFDAKDVKK
jgi:hypothetical protein